MSESRVIRVFISSTFSDFAEERDLFVRRVFPELRRKCRERQVELVDVDLRWGITEEEARQGKVLPICLAEIDRSRPYFIGLLGERYGWVPEKNQYDLSLLLEQPWLDEHRGGKSVTELEILHGVLNNPEMAGHAFFYFRDPTYAVRKGVGYVETGEQQKEKLQALKDRIHKSGYPVEENYRSPEALAERVKNDLWKLIDEIFPVQDVPDALTRERMGHETFTASRLGLYIGGETYFTALDSAVTVEPRKPVLVTGESGGGKSALLANWAARFTKKNPDAILLSHCLATGADAAHPVSMVVRLLREISYLIGEELVLDGDPRNALHMLTPWLAKAGEFANGKGGVFVLVLDGLDKMDTPTEMGWWPAKLPDGVGLVASSLPGPVFDAVADRMDWGKVLVSPLEREECRKFIVDHLGKYRKSLTPEFTERVLSHPLSGNPLFLRTLLEELRVFGVHEELGRKIDHYLASQTVVDLFDQVLERMEEDNSPGPVSAALQVLWAAKESFAEDELLAVSGLPPAAWAPVRAALDESLIAEGGRLAFIHDYLRKAVEDRYLPTAEDRRHIQKRMADFCVSTMEGGRKNTSHYVRRHAVEHYLEVQDWDSAVDALSDIEFIEARAIAQELPAMLADYNAVAGLLPEGKKERKMEATRQAELHRYAVEMTQYAAAWTRIRDRTNEAEPTLPRHVESVRLWTSEELAAECKRMTETPNRLDMVKVFRVFVATNTAPLQKHSRQEGFAANLAVNDAPTGPVREEGKRLLEPQKCIKLIKQFASTEVFNPLPPCQAVFETSSITSSVALSADGLLAVSGGDDSTLRVWNLESGGCINVLEDHTDRINSVALSADGQIAVSGSSDKTLRVWNLKSGECLRVLEGHDAAINSVALTADGRLAVSGDDDITLRVWNLDSGECLMVSEFVPEQGRKGHMTPINSVALSVDGRIAVSGSGNFDGWDGTLCFWNLSHLRSAFSLARTLHPGVSPTRRGKPIKILEDCHDGAITSLALSVDGRIAVSGSDDYTLCVWNLESGECIKVLEGHKNAITSVALSADGRLAVSAGRDKTLRLWNLDSGECLKLLEVEGYDGAINSLAMSADGRLAVSATNDNTLRVWNFDYSEFGQEKHAGTVYFLALSADGRLAVSAGGDKTLRIWNPESGECLKVLAGHEGTITALLLSADGQFAISASNDTIPSKYKYRFKSTLRVWNLESGECLKVLEADGLGMFTPIALSADGQLAVSASFDNTLRVWNLESGECLKVLEGHEGKITSLVLSADGQLAVSASFDKTLRIWNLESGECLKVLEGHEGEITSLVLSADGQLAVSASFDNTLRVWNLESGECLKVLEGHEGSVTSLFLSADGQLAISVSGGAFSSDNTLRIWNLESGKCLTQFFIRGIASFTLHPRFQKMVIGFTTGRVEFFDIENSK